jgi:DNA methylase
MSARLIIADVFDALGTLAAGSVDLVVTSPPFLALRSYLPPDHPLKDKEIGSEATPGEFLDAMLDVTEALARVLAPHGSIVVELGDTFSGSGGAGGDYGWDRLGARGEQDDQPPNYRRKGQVFEGSKSQSRNGRRNRPADVAAGILAPQQRPGPEGRDAIHGWPLDKGLCAIPALYEVALAYGLNPLTGRQTDRWRVRNLVVWHRPNPPVGALGDKWRPSCSFVTVACKSRTRYFDQDAVRTPGSENTHARTANGVASRPSTGKTADAARGGNFSTLATLHDSAGAPPQDWLELPDAFEDEGWTLSTQAYKGSHYATFPEAFVVPFVASMCPERVCVKCGEPSRRIVESERVRVADGLKNPPRQPPTRNDAGGSTAIGIRKMIDTTRTTLGWTECDCSDDLPFAPKWRPGLVLDPFCGSGTVGQVATRMGRDALLIDIDERNEQLVRERVGLFYEGASRA